MTDMLAVRRQPVRPWPMTGEAHRHLTDEIAQLRADIASLAGQGMEEGIVRLPVAQASRRLETLLEVLESAEVIEDGVRAAIGRQATLRDDEGLTMQYRIVFPGDGDPARGWISADAPLGRAILGARPGATVEVPAPIGRWSVTVVAVE